MATERTFPAWACFKATNCDYCRRQGGRACNSAEMKRLQAASEEVLQCPRYVRHEQAEEAGGGGQGALFELAPATVAFDF